MTSEIATGEPSPGAGRDPLLEVRDLRVSFRAGADEVRAVDGVSLAVGRGEALAIVGESGAGKSATAAALLGLDRPPAARVEGSVRLEGTELVGASEAELRGVRGRRMAMIFQDPATALDPLQRVGRQVAEQIEAHEGGSAPDVGGRVVELLERAGLPRPHEVARSYPFQLSGGMRQRAMIAMAISCGPDVLIADEPTAALDAVVQAQVLALVDDLRRERGMAILLATHDLRAVARIADRVAVMQAGRIVEAGPAEEVLMRPRHDHTRRLLRTPGSAGAPPLAGAGEREAGHEPLLEVQGLEVGFRLRGGIGLPSARIRRLAALLRPRGRQRASGRPLPSAGIVRAVEDVDLEVAPGETLALVGQSGSGKTTLSRAILRLVDPTAGSVRFRGRELTTLGQRALRPLRREMQAVFQDPAASLNPRKRVAQVVGAPLRRHGVGRAEAEARAAELLERVELSAAYLNRFPHELSGGQRQRVGIARALALEPRLLILDEPVSALDAPVRAQVMDLLQRLQRELGPAYLLITHDLELARRVAHRVAVMHEGRVVESGSPEALASGPRHPATRALMSAAYAAARDEK